MVGGRIFRKIFYFFGKYFFGIFHANEGSEVCRISRLVGVEHIKSDILRLINEIIA